MRPINNAIRIALVLLVNTASAEDNPPRQPVALQYVTGSTNKLEQLIGDFDKQMKSNTRNRTWSRFRIRGTDLGSSFEHEGKLIFLFGDTIGPGGGDCLAGSDSADPETGLTLDFFQAARGDYLKIAPPGIGMGGFEVPTGGISLGGQAYLFCTTDHSSEHVMGRSVLARFDAVTGRFTTLRDISRRPGNFINVTARLAPTEIVGLPEEVGTEPVLLWGSGAYRQSHAYLACIAAGRMEQNGAMFYFCGFDNARRPRWNRDESSAVPVVQHPVIGELSVTWCEQLQIWLMTYNSQRPRGITLRWSRTPWGPWSEGVVIFHPWRDGGYGKFMRAPIGNAGPWGPVIAPKGKPEDVWGGEYGPYMIERFTQFSDTSLTIYYVMSTWNPYTVVLMKSQLEVQFRTE